MKTGWLGCFAASPPSTVGMEVAGVEWWRLLFFALIFVGLFILWWWVNRGRISFKNILKPSEPKIKVEDQRWLNSRSSVVLVQVEGERFLLAQSQHGVAWQKLASGVTLAAPPPVTKN
jgi:flagellar biogenesis protein FliO